MLVPKLLSLSSEQDVTTLEVHNKLVMLVNTGRASEAILLLAHLYTFTTYSGRTEKLKSQLLRNTWRNIQRFYEIHFSKTVEDSLRFVQQSTKHGCAHPKLAELSEVEIIRYQKPEILAEIGFAKELGKACVLVDLMASGVIPMDEANLKSVAASLTWDHGRLKPSVLR